MVYQVQGKEKQRNTMLHAYKIPLPITLISISVVSAVTTDKIRFALQNETRKNTRRTWHSNKPLQMREMHSMSTNIHVKKKGMSKFESSFIKKRL